MAPPQPTVSVIVPALETLLKNFMTLFQILEQHGVQFPSLFGTATTEPPMTLRIEPNIFRQKGEVWDIVYQGHSFSLKNIKGLHYIAFLLRHPTKKFTPHG